MGDNEFKLKSVISKCENPDFGVVRIQKDSEEPVKALLDTVTPRLRTKNGEVSLNQTKDKGLIDSYKAADDPNLRQTDFVKKACEEINPVQIKPRNILWMGAPLVLRLSQWFTNSFFVNPLNDAGIGNLSLRNGLFGVQAAAGTGATFLYTQWQPDLSDNMALGSDSVYVVSSLLTLIRDRGAAEVLNITETGIDVTCARIARHGSRGAGIVCNLVAGAAELGTGLALHLTSSKISPQSVAVNPTLNQNLYSGNNEFESNKPFIRPEALMFAGGGRMAVGIGQFVLKRLSSKSAVNLSFNTFQGIRGEPGVLGGISMVNP